MSVEESNRMIAEFMCGQKDDNWEELAQSSVIDAFEDDLKYHISWDQLMPVGKKLRELLGTAKSTEEFLVIVELVEAITSFDIELAHKAIVQVIDWYNENYKP